MPTPILITGAAGFAGSHLVERLGGGESPIVAWHRPGHPPPPSTRAQWEAVDLLDRNAVRDAIERARPAVVYHCAGAAHVGSSWGHVESTLAVNVRGTHHLLEALRLARVTTRVLVPSSAMVYAPAAAPIAEDARLLPPSPYGLSKLAQELLAVRASGDGIAVLIARPFNHIGPRQSASFVAASFARQIAEIEAGHRDPDIVVGNLEARRDMHDVRDTVRAYTMIVERGRPERPYNVCSGSAIAIRELLDRLVARARVAVHVRVDPARYQPNDLPLLVGDRSRIRDEIGWEPAISLDRTIEDLLGYWRGVVGGPRPVGADMHR